MINSNELQPPVAKKIPTPLTMHGDTRVDPYFWMKERENPDVIAYLEAENAYSKGMLAHTESLQETLFQEMKGRIQEEDQSVPYKKNGYFYITRFEEGFEYPIYSRKKDNLDAPEEIMLNVNELAKEHAFYDTGSLSVSPDNKILAYTEDVLSRRIYTVKFKNLETGVLLEDQIPNMSGRVVWANDNQTVFYVLKDLQTLRDYRVMRHKLGTSVDQDVEIFTETDNTFLSFVAKTKSEKYIIIGSYHRVSQEYRILEADHPEGLFRMVQPREKGLEYSLDHFDDKFYIKTNLDAPNFRLMVAPENNPSKESWTELIPHRPDVLLEEVNLFKEHLVLSERIAGISEIRILSWDGKEDHYVAFPEKAHMAYTTTNPEFDTKVLRLGYQSMKTPSTTYDYDMETKTFTLLKQVQVLGGFDSADYVSERLFIEARDGQQIPLSIVYHKDFQKDGKRPLLLYAYGSYGHSMDPYFSSARLSLLNRGFAYVIAHIRGGEEMGRKWYEEGKLLKKKNTFFDFIDAAEALIHLKYTNSDRLFAMGGSAGGLLMGAIANLRPDLWKGIIASVPFVDVVTTMLDDTIPLTTFEYDEWGNPNVKAYYDYMKSYSPYDNVEAKAYPAMFILTGLHDSQVQYWEPAKWVAKLRDLKTDSNPLLFHVNMEAGHGGASGRFRSLKETAMEFAFIIDQANLQD